MEPNPVWDFPVGASGKEPACQCRRHRFDPWVGKIPWRRAWEPTPVFLLGESHRQTNPVGNSPWGRKKSGTTEVTQRAIQCDWYPYKKSLGNSYMHRGKAMQGDNEKAAISPPRREASEETRSANTLILDFQPPEVWANKCVLWRLLSLCYFVMAALANKFVWPIQSMELFRPVSWTG